MGKVPRNLKDAIKTMTANELRMLVHYSKDKDARNELLKRKLKIKKPRGF